MVLKNGPTQPKPRVTAPRSPVSRRGIATAGQPTPLASVSSLRAVDRLKCLASPPHLRTLIFLGDGERSAGEVGSSLEMRPPEASKLLAKLRLTGLVAVRPEGQRRYYGLTDDGRRALDVIGPLLL